MAKRQLANAQQHTYTSFDNTTICYETTLGVPSKPTLVFLHGMGGDLTAWDKERQYFQDKGFATLAIDLRGHGFSGRPTHFDSYAFTNFAKDISLVLQHEHIKNYILIGHCLGSIVSIVGISHGLFKPKAAILISAGYGSSPFGKLFTNNSFFRHLLVLFATIPLRFALPTRPDYTTRNYIGTQDIDIRRLTLDILHTSLQSFLATLCHLNTFHGFSLLQKLTMPTLLVTGDEDTFFPVTVARTLSENIKQAKLVIIPKANHILLANNPKEVCQALDVFISNDLA